SPLPPPPSPTLFPYTTLFRSRAAEADAALAEADRAASEQYVILSRNIERREHERLLHDTVLNTLTALARAGPGDAAGVVSRCRRSEEHTSELQSQSNLVCRLL